MTHMTKAQKAAEPRISVFCRCGAQWHGRFAVDNPVIADHAARATCELLSRVEYELAGYVVKLPAYWTFPVEPPTRSDLSDVSGRS
jgi:hypothetical protein